MNTSKPSRSQETRHEERRRELIAALKELAAAEGPDVTHLRFAKSLGRSSRYEALYFGSWSDLREAAGLPRKRRAGYSAEFLIETLQRVEREYGRPVSRRRFAHLTGISPLSCDRLFGSWREFREAAGLEGMASAGVPRKYTRDDLLRMMREQIPLLGRNMTRNQFANATDVSTATIDRLGNWSALRRELGLSPRGDAEAQRFLDALGIELLDEPLPLFDATEEQVRPAVPAAVSH